MKFVITGVIFFTAVSVQVQTGDSLSKRPLMLRPVFSLAPDHYSKNMGFICKKELVMQKALKLPVFIRLGSLQYTNYLEGKSKLH